MSNGAAVSAAIDSTGPGASRRGGGFALAATVAIIIRDVLALRHRPGHVVGNLLLPIVLQLALASGYALSFGRPLLEPYDSYVAMADYVVPGLVGLVLLVAGARSALAMTTGLGPSSIRPLLTTPVPIPMIVVGKLIAAALVATLQAYLFVVAARIAGADVEVDGWLAALPTVLVGSFMLTGVLAVIVIASRYLRSLARLLLLILLPALFLSSAFYPLWQFTTNDAGYLEAIAYANPFTHVVELVRYASEGQLAMTSLAVVLVVGIAAYAAVTVLVDPRRRLFAWRGSTGAPNAG